MYVCRYVRMYVCMYVCMYIRIYQGGMQPIHSAAIVGHIDVIYILVDKYGVNPQEEADVSN